MALESRLLTKRCPKGKVGLSRFVEGRRWNELETVLALRWQGNFSRICEIYEGGGKSFVSLSYYGYAVLCHEVCRFQHNNVTYFSFKDTTFVLHVRTKTFYVTRFESPFFWQKICEDVPENGLFWQSCHELLDAAKFKGYLTEIVAPLGVACKQ